MATAPQIEAQDGTFTQNLVLTTNVETIFLGGTVSANTIDVQVSVDGQPYVSDPTLVYLDGTLFQVPNPTSFPEGLTLNLGVNNIAIRAIDLVGSVSPASTAQITRVQSIDQARLYIPTGIRVRRRRDSVDILASLPVSGLEFKGFNFYASTSAGGMSGRFQVNTSPVSEISVQEEDLIGLETGSAVFTPAGGKLVRTVVTEEDEFGQVLQTAVNKTTDVSAISTPLKFESTLSSRDLAQFIAFRHKRTGTASDNTSNSDQFVDVDDSEPLYYTVTGLFYDSAQNREFETPHSQEVLANPLVIETNLRDLPGRNAVQITTDYVSAIQRVNNEISLIPGATTRDTSIDPFASEAERIWFVVDFVHRSQSFLTLLQIDDANGDGISDPVVGSAYKTSLKAALGLQTDSAVQNLIDTQFDKLGGNFHKSRLPGRPATGQVVYYTTTRPVKDMVISSGAVVSTEADPGQGISASRFVIGGTYVLPVSDADAFFNFDTGQYEITAEVTAQTVGLNGNRSANQIKSVVSGAPGFQVVNREATTFGLNRETNTELALRAQLGFVSVDTGTEGGYASTAAETIGIIKHKIVKSGDPLMMRDYDDVRRKHIGGKVDVWFQGLRERTVTDKFAFSFEIARDIRCQIIDIPTLTFRVLDTRVTINTPIVEMLSDVSLGFGVRNVTTGSDYNMAGVQIVDFETFRLDSTIVQPTTNIDDIISADYRFRSINQFVFTLQPVRRVVSVVGQSSGPLSLDAGFSFYKTADPLLNGESVLSDDYLVINQVSGIPTGDTITVTDEPHVLIGQFDEPLLNVGINIATLKVFSEDRSIEYAGPSDASPDYDVDEGTDTTPVKIVRTASSTIGSGQSVVVDYTHDENFTVTYVINDLLQQLQRILNVRRHVTADVLAKQAIQNSIDFDVTAQLKSGATKGTTDPAIRTNVSIELNTKLIGQGTAQSDLVQTVDSTTGVDFQVIPLSRLGYSDGSRKLRESVLNTNIRLPTLDLGGNQAFLLTNPLQSPTTDGGGLLTEHRGVFQDDEPMSLASTLDSVCQQANRSYIIGYNGADIAGYSDDLTLQTEGYTDPDDLLAEKLRRTANHVVLSLTSSSIPSDNPDQHKYAVSYVIRNDVGPHDIVVSDVESISLGRFTLTLKEKLQR